MRPNGLARAPPLAAPSEEASGHFLDVASTPPHEDGTMRRRQDEAAVGKPGFRFGDIDAARKLESSKDFLASYPTLRLNQHRTRGDDDLYVHGACFANADRDRDKPVSFFDMDLRLEQPLLFCRQPIFQVQGADSASIQEDLVCPPRNLIVHIFDFIDDVFRNAYWNQHGFVSLNASTLPSTVFIFVNVP
jgi:hypothetical protein